MPDSWRLPFGHAPHGGKALFPALMEARSRETEEVVIFGRYFGVRFCVRPAKSWGPKERIPRRGAENLTEKGR